MESTTEELRDLSLTGGSVLEHDDVEPSYEPQVHLAFLEEPDGPESLQRHRFPNKAGGAPAWLDPVNLPSGESRLCDFCGEPLRFAVQVYAPFPTAYHRTLFVFMCPSMSCCLLEQRSEEEDGIGTRRRRSVKVFRCQLPRDNAFYSYDSATDDDDNDDDEEESDDTTAAPLCVWCATWKAEVVCGGAAKYCSEKHRDLHLSDCCGDVIVSSEDGTAASRSGHHQAVPFAGAVWPEYVMNTEEETLELINSSADHLSVPSPATQDEQGPDDDDDEEDDTAAWMASLVEEEDAAAWASFSARVSMANQGAQVLRYCSEEGARPLWAAAAGSLRADDDNAVPPCAHCGGPMLFEMQVMPQLLHFFRVEARDPDPLNWATVVVYTCARSCDGGGRYKEEFAWVQLDPVATGGTVATEADDEK